MSIEDLGEEEPLEERVLTLSLLLVLFFMRLLVGIVLAPTAAWV